MNKMLKMKAIWKMWLHVIVYCESKCLVCNVQWRKIRIFSPFVVILLGWSLPELTYKKLAGIFVCIQRTSAGCWSLHGMGNETCKNPSTKWLAVYWIFCVRSSHYISECRCSSEFIIRASHPLLHNYNINNFDGYDNSSMSGFPPENERNSE